MKVAHLFPEFCPKKSPFRYWLVTNPHVDTAVYCLRRTNEHEYPHKDVHSERVAGCFRSFSASPIGFFTDPIASVCHHISWSRFLKKSGCQLIHVQFGDKAVRLLPMLNRSALPLVVTFHGSDINRALRSDMRREGLKRLFQRTSLCHFVSDDLRQKGLELGCPEEIAKTIYIGSPINDKRSPVKHEDERSKINFFCVANLIPCKGHATLLKAFSLAQKVLPESKLHLLGDGPLREQLKRRSKDLNIASSVKFHGHLPNSKVIDFLRSQAHIKILASQRDEAGSEEGLPISLQEAGALGIPCIGTNCGGIKEVIVDKETGYVVPQVDASSLGNAMIQLATQPHLRSQFGEAAFERSQKLFNLNIFYYEISKAYASVI